MGKTHFADLLAAQLPSEIVNADMGQLYTPLTIGTAKPDWRKSPVPQHLFDIINEPRVITVTEYRDRVINTVEAIWARKNIPILVGWLRFLFAITVFPSCSHE